MVPEEVNINGNKEISHQITCGGIRHQRCPISFCFPATQSSLLATIQPRLYNVTQLTPLVTRHHPHPGRAGRPTSAKLMAASAHMAWAGTTSASTHSTASGGCPRIAAATGLRLVQIWNGHNRRQAGQCKWWPTETRDAWLHCENTTDQEAHYMWALVPGSRFGHISGF